MNSHLQYLWAKERMSQMHEDAARRALVRSLCKPFSLRLAHTLIRVGGWIAQRASHLQEERLSAALNRTLDVRYERSDRVYVVHLGHPNKKRLGSSDDEGYTAYG